MTELLDSGPDCACHDVVLPFGVGGPHLDLVDGLRRAEPLRTSKPQRTPLGVRARKKRNLAASGADIWVHQALSVVHDTNGFPAEAVSQIEDISDRKRAEAQLPERFHELADNVDVGFLIRRVDTAEFVYLNPAFRTVFGFAADGPAPTDAEVMARVHPDDVERVNDILLECIGGQRVETEFRLIRPGGEQRWVSTKGSPIIDPDQQIRRVAGLFQDITERRSQEEALALARAEAERANAAKSEFLSRLSHELRTPLNAVIGFGQLLKLSPLAPDQEESVGYILSGGRHLLTMINDILDVSRIDAGRLELSIEDVDVSELVHETLGLMEPLAAANGITLSVTSDGECSVHADRRRLKQALLNLTSNAIKYNRPGGRVQLTTRPVGDSEVSIAVTDTGLGIPTEDLPRLFHPFDRLGRDFSPIEGTGIGLTLSKSLVTLMNGRLDVASTDGVGSTFAITLPNAARPETLARTTDPAPGADEPQPLVAVPPQSNLLNIEDNPANVALLSAAVGHLPGWTPTHANNGSGGLQMVCSSHQRSPCSTCTYPTSTAPRSSNDEEQPDQRSDPGRDSQRRRQPHPSGAATCRGG